MSLFLFAKLILPYPKFTGNAEIVAAAKLICDEAVKTTA